MRVAYRLSVHAVVLLAASTAWAESAGTEVTGVREMNEICRAVEPSEEVSFAGNAYERGQQRAAHRAGREAALGALYVIAIPATDFQLVEYNVETRELEVDTASGLTAHDGGTALVLQQHESLVATVDPDRARELAELHQRGQLDLRLGFFLRPATAEAAPCSRARTPTSPVRVEIEVAFFELRQGRARTIARVELQAAAELAPSARPPSPARPSVTIGEPSVITNGNLSDLAEAPAGEQLRGRYLACFTRRLADRPGLEGSIVVQLAVAGGHLRSAHLEIDSVGDEAMAACVLQQTRTFPFPRGITGAISLPLRFRP